ncbi:amidohydrolase family protein [Pusillimonas sp. SM2304]|uniref:amidohydrolase family protein n=1 Tax=Pusillimonas sp. SM2304 TaxID=3073241 RepID=UPI0028770FD5|nr:amidohydrolase family protein [Pusillimonas sp. SM2304]MDS1139425.1 amidohydrolase family protein [Pusillimonas sp. SM2304]
MNELSRFATATAAAPHSLGTNKPKQALPANACDSHMHIFDPQFSVSAHWGRTPPVARVDAYRRLQARLGTTRAVVVTPSTYGTDNACTIDALMQLGEDARGVAVVDANATQSELGQLAVHGVCGLRVNFVTRQSWGETTAGLLTALADKAAGFGWHIQIFVHPEQLVALAPVLSRLPVPLVIDHMGRLDPAEAGQGEAYTVMRRLLDQGNAWVKLSGAYMRSASGEPNYADTLSLGRALVRHAPERLVWGSDWPHTTQHPDSVNDAHLVDLLYGWCATQDMAQRVLVDNPARLYGFPL